MKASKFTEAQKAFILKQGEEGTSVAEICRKAGIGQSTYFAWKKKYGGLLPDEMRRLIVGVDGSHLVHGLAAMPREAALIVIQPPDRVVATLKTVTDRQSQRYAFVVADGNAARFRVDLDDVRRTLDLLD